MKLNFARYGIPQKLVSDNGPQFTSQEFKIFTDEWDIELDLTSPRHPQANGKAESAVGQNAYGKSSPLQVRFLLDAARVQEHSDTGLGHNSCTANALWNNTLVASG